MMIQATIPTALGLFFTPWHLTSPLLVAAGATMAAISIMFVAFSLGIVRRGLLAGMPVLYAAFDVLIAVLHIGG